MIAVICHFWYIILFRELKWDFFDFIAFRKGIGEIRVISLF